MIMGTITVHPTLPLMDRECLERHHFPLLNHQHGCHRPSRGRTETYRGGGVAAPGRRFNAESNLGFEAEIEGNQSHLMPMSRSRMRRYRWRIPFALDSGGPPKAGSQDSLDGGDAGLGRTRLGAIVRAAARQLLDKLNAARKNFPVKIFLLLLGFYTANALATILGQTGDWDVLVAGVVVAAIEGIGMLMYRKPFALPVRRLQSLVGMVNYWKAGVCLGLFVDAFKLGS